MWCGIRDKQQIMEITDIQTYYRGYDPTGIRDVTLTGINVPCRIGNAIAMPGDVVLGTPAGVLFVPPHLAEECCTKAEKTSLRDHFGLLRLTEGVYTTAQMDSVDGRDQRFSRLAQREHPAGVRPPGLDR